MWTIYKHTNKITKEIYIGQTMQNVEKRWSNGISYINNYQNDKSIGAAIKQYGWENFEHEILEKDILTIEEANQKESYWINYYHCYIGDPEYKGGYNLTSGGRGSTQRQPMSVEGREKISQANKKRFATEEGRLAQAEKIRQYRAENPYTEEEIQKISDGLKRYWDGNDAAKNAQRERQIKRYENPEEREKTRQAIIKAHGVKVRCIETNMEFNSATEAAQWCGIKRCSNITDCAKGKNKSAGKHPETKVPLHWEFI